MPTVKFSPRRIPAGRPTPDYVHQFLVVLGETDPLVWRRIQVPPVYSFWDLHVAIQDAMGWEEHESTLEWAGGSFDPQVFDPAAVKFDDPKKR